VEKYSAKKASWSTATAARACPSGFGVKLVNPETQRVWGDVDRDVAVSNLQRSGSKMSAAASGSWKVMWSVSGPFEAVTEFLDSDHHFEVDVSRERMLFTFNPKGFLRRRVE
jgi:hypothetical protein